MRFQILGPTAAWRADGEPVALADGDAGRAAALLCEGPVL